MALHNYHEHYGSLPPAYVADANGRPMHSWRVLILPFVEASDLYDRYDLSQAWNSPAHAALMDEMPRVFASNTEDDSKRFTNMMVITGEKTAFPYASSTRFEDFADGRENVLLITETANSRVPWTKPQDIEFDTLLTGPAPVVSAASWRAPYITFADGIKVYDVMPSAGQRDLQDLATIAGQEKTTRKSMLQEGKLEK